MFVHLRDPELRHANVRTRATPADYTTTTTADTTTTTTEANRTGFRNFAKE